MGSDQKNPSARALEEQLAGARQAAHARPWVGAVVHYFDESRAGAYARMGTGPYAATITCVEGGVSLFVMGPQGGRFDVEKVAHKSQLPEGQGKKRWWEWPDEAQRRS